MSLATLRRKLEAKSDDAELARAFLAGTLKPDSAEERAARQALARLLHDFARILMYFSGLQEFSQLHGFLSPLSLWSLVDLGYLLSPAGPAEWKLILAARREGRPSTNGIWLVIAWTALSRPRHGIKFAQRVWGVSPSTVKRALIRYRKLFGSNGMSKHSALIERVGQILGSN
jgi:hypothetical protein